MLHLVQEITQVTKGDFVKNSITGNGIYRWLDSSTYEGQVLNGRYNGFGVFRLPDGQRSYSGEWVMGEKHGKGMMAYDCEGRSYYNGDWVHNIKQGYGKRQYPSGNIYEGSWFDNVRQGEGVMKWFDKRGNITDLYSGLWEYGEQHGFGHHIWFLKRVVSSQYPLRNMYTGDFVKGRRQGFGVFVYANGARYEGMWCDNKKHGKGKFIFKNGRVYEGEFENDRTTEYPEMDLAALATPDQSRIRTRTPLPREISNASVSSNNTYSPSLQLQLAYLLRQLPEADRDEEQRQLMLTVTRHMTSLRRIYTFYSCVGCMEIDEKGCSYPDNTYVMGRLQLWRCLKDSRLHYEDITLSEMDCILAAAAEGTGDEDIHSPATSILFREFLHFIIILAFHIYHSKHTGSDAVTSWCLSKLMTEKLNKYACSIKGFIYNDSRRTFQVQPYQDKTYEIYKTFAKTRKQAPYDKFMTMRQFLFLMKDLKLINSDLTAKAIIDILASDDPKVRDAEGSINMELEMTFLEFFEALVGCAEVYVTEEVRKEPNSPPHSVLMTHTHSVMSFYGNHSHEPSQFGLDDMSAANLGDDGAMSPDGQETPGGHSASRSRAEARQRPEAVASTGSVLDAETFRKAETPKDGPGEAASRLSDAQGGLVQSNASVKADNCFDDDNVTGANGVLDAAEEGTEFNDDEELDEDIKKFNMWTYQIHIFFKKKFFPAAQHFAELCDTVRSSNSIPQKVEITP